MRSKGQVEIMGLLLIVVLMALGLLFALYFALSSDSSDEQDVKDEVMVSMTLGALRKVTAPSCDNVQFQDLLEDCAGGRSLQCSTGSSCSVAHELIAGTLDSFFSPMQENRQYFFTIDRLPYFVGRSYGSACNYTVARVAHEEPVTVDIGYEVIMRLEVCG